jgi:outer membrane protein assembly factor BamB
MSARKFITELERRKFLSDRLMKKLRESLAATRSPLSAEKLAAFLVQKNHLTKRQADDILANLTQSGVNLIEEDPDDAGGAESSSIFAPPAAGRRNKEPAPDDDNEEIRLAPIEEDAETPKPSKRRAGDEEDVPILGTVPPADKPRPRRSKTSPAVKLAELEEVGDFSEPAQNKALDNLATDEPPAEPGTRARRTSNLTRGKGAKRKVKSSKEKKRWDSPLMLIGGGALVFLLLAGGTIWFLLVYESGEQKLASAREAAKSGQYSQAIDLFQEFITSSPRHPQNSSARVALATLKIRQPAEAPDFERALSAAENETKAVEDEAAFNEAHEELAALLPQIAEGLAKQAEDAAPTSEDSKKFVGLAKKALELCSNTSFLPKSLRDEGKLTAVRDTLDRAERRQYSQHALADGLKAMEEAVTAGKPMDAYAAHTKLTKEHPELANEKTLAEAIAKTAAAEQAAIKFVAEKQPAETAERPTPWVAALAVASHRGGNAPATGVACVRVDGAVYGLDAASGRLLWRRYAGFNSTGWPILAAGDVLVTDSVRHELLRLEAATGKLVWRQAFKEAFAEPLVVGEQVFVASDAGRVYVVDLKTGERTGYLQLPQPIRVAPAIDRLKTHLYLAGDRASLYAISLSDMKCLGVYFLGHAPGTIQVAPVVVMDKLVVVENHGAETSRLRLLAVDDKYAISKQQALRRLSGLVTTPPLGTGRGLIVITDRRQMEVYDISAGNEGPGLTVVATRDALGAQPLMRHAAVVGRSIWIADTQLAKFNIVPTGNRLPVEEIQNSYTGATFDQPLAAFGDTLIVVHRPKGRAGAVVAALDTKQGRMLWETDLAMPPAGAPVVDEARKSLTIANAAGYAFRFDAAAIQSRVQDQPLKADLAPPQPPALTASTDLGQGRAVFTAANSDWLVIYDPAHSDSVKWVRAAGPLACTPTPLGPGFVAPLKIGQVFYLSSSDGARLATPFQPRIEPGATFEYKSAGALAGGDQFVITDSAKKIYLVAVANQPQPHLQMLMEAEVGPRPIGSPIVVLGDTAMAVAGDSRLVRFKLPALESAGETNLTAPVEWGPYTAGDAALVATVDQKLTAATAAGEVRWEVPLEHGPLAGAPLVAGDSVYLTFRKGIVERRALADGNPTGTLNVEHPLATGPALFQQRLVVAAADGTLLVIDQPK